MFLTVILGVIALALSLSVFFYVRSREPIWDNRSKLSRLIASNHHAQNFGSEIFTMFGTGAAITINGSGTIENQNTPYLTNGSVYLVEVQGFSRNDVSGNLSSFSSKVLVDKTGSGTILKMEGSDVQVNPTTVEIQPITGADVFQISCNGNRLEFSGGTLNSKYQLGFRILGRKLI
jgi:hypothetical protein